MLKAVEVAAKNTLAKIHKVTDLMASTRETRYPECTQPSFWILFFDQPYCRIQSLVKGLNVTRQTASNYLKSLCDLGILEERKEGRFKLFVNPHFIEILRSK